MPSIDIQYSWDKKPKISLRDKVRSWSNTLFDLMQSHERQSSLPLQPDNYKIDAWLSITQKPQKGWRQEDVVFEDAERKHTIIPMLIAHISTQYGYGRILEYIPDEFWVVPQNLIGEQLFDKDAIDALWLKQALPTHEDLQDLRYKQVRHHNFLYAHFQKNGKIILPGYRNYHDNDAIIDAGKSAYYRVGLQNGGKWKITNIGGVAIDDKHITYKQVHSREFMSLRLLAK